MPNLPQWAWIAIAVLGFLWARKNGYLQAFLAAANDAKSLTPSATPAAPVQTIAIRTLVPGEPSPADPGLTEVRRVGFEFDVAIKPVPKPPGIP